MDAEKFYKNYLNNSDIQKKYLNKDKKGFLFEVMEKYSEYKNDKKIERITEPKEVSFKYFSHLNNNQQKRTINYLRIFKNNLENKKYKNALLELKEDPKEIEKIKKSIKAQKVFRDPFVKVYFPLNYEEIIK
jgi:dGTP triphosphohydrolase